jgi:hypothetical protein
MVGAALGYSPDGRATSINAASSSRMAAKRRMISAITLLRAVSDGTSIDVAQGFPMRAQPYFSRRLKNFMFSV